MLSELELLSCSIIQKSAKTESLLSPGQIVSLWHCLQNLLRQMASDHSHWGPSVWHQCCTLPALLVLLGEGEFAYTFPWKWDSPTPKIPNREKKSWVVLQKELWQNNFKPKKALSGREQVQIGLYTQLRTGNPGLYVRFVASPVIFQ